MHALLPIVSPLAGVEVLMRTRCVQLSSVRSPPTYPTAVHLECGEPFHRLDGR